MESPELREILNTLNQVRTDIQVHINADRPKEAIEVAAKISKIIRKVFGLNEQSLPVTKRDALDCRLYFMNKYTTMSPVRIATVLNLKVKRDVGYKKIKRIKAIVDFPLKHPELHKKITEIDNILKTL